MTTHKIIRWMERTDSRIEGRVAQAEEWAADKFGFAVNIITAAAVVGFLAWLWVAI